MHNLTKPEHDSFAFVFTPLEYADDLPVELVPNFWLDRPTDDQLQIIIEAIVIRSGNPMGVLSRYQHEWIGNSTSDLPRNQWRYLVINFRSESYFEEFRRLGDALMLVGQGVEVTWAWMPWGKDYALAGPSGHVGHGVSFFSSYFHPSTQIPKLTEFELSEVRELYSRQQAVRGAYPYIERAHGQYRTLLHLPREEPFSWLAHFSFIESLLAHKPDPKDPTDSLSRQVSSKLTLLSKRFTPPLDHREYFCHETLSDPITFWKRMYALRSNIAHGQSIFSGNLNPLEASRDNLREFLQYVALQSLKFAIREPILVADLRNC